LLLNLPADLLQEVNAMDELKRNLDQEHNCFFRFQAEIHDTLSTIQFANALALKQMDQVSIWTLMQLLAAQDAAKRGIILANCPAQAYDGLTVAPQNGHSQPQRLGGGAAAPADALASTSQLTQGFGESQQMYQQPGVNALPEAPPAFYPQPTHSQANAGTSTAFQPSYAQNSYQAEKGYSQAEQPLLVGPESAQGTDSHHSPTQ